jgi:hypothetical protein
MWKIGAIIIKNISFGKGKIKNENNLYKEKRIQSQLK